MRKLDYYYVCTHKNKEMSDFQILSRRQVELAYYLRRFRETHGITMSDLAFRCTCFGKPFNVKVVTSEISKYERLIDIPTQKKMKVVMMAIGVTMDDLDKRK